MINKNYIFLTSAGLWFSSIFEYAFLYYPSGNHSLLFVQIYKQIWYNTTISGFSFPDFIFFFRGRRKGFTCRPARLGRIARDYILTFAHFYFAGKFNPKRNDEGFRQKQRGVSANATWCFCLKNTFFPGKCRFRRKKPILRNADFQGVLNFGF